MPLPKKLPNSASKKKKNAVMKKTMHELKNAPVEAPSRKATSGEQRQKQNIAIALQKIGQSKSDKPNGRKRKRPRNKGRS